MLAALRQPGINPATADYSGISIYNLLNAVYLRIDTPRGSYWDDINFGSRLYLLQREKDLPNRQQRAREYVAEALQPLLDDGRAESIETRTEQLGDGRLRILVKVFQAGDVAAELEHFVGVE